MTQATKTLADQVRQGDRRALAKAITLAESTRDDHRQQTAELLETLIPDSGNSIRIGISGAPGVGKSTFIEVLGSHLKLQRARPAKFGMACAIIRPETLCAKCKSEIAVSFIIPKKKNRLSVWLR